MSALEIDPNTPEIVFMSSLRTMLKSVGITQNQEAMDYFKLMEEAVIRDVFHRQNPDNTERYKEHRSRQIFIKIFQSRYKLTYDIDYEIPVGDKSAKMIGNLLTKLEKDEIPIDYYLEWFFETYIQEKKFTVESIMNPCQAWVLQSFKLQNRDSMEEIKEKKKEELEIVSLLDKARELVRTARVLNENTLEEEIVQTSKSFKAKGINLETYREMVKSFSRRMKTIKEQKMLGRQEKQTEGEKENGCGIVSESE